MELNEGEVRQRLIDRLLDLGYPKSSILLEVALVASNGTKPKIDVAIQDPSTNQLLAFFEIKRSASNLQGAIDQAIAYSKLLSKKVQVFVYSLTGSTESLFLVNLREGSASQVVDLPSFDSLKQVNVNEEKDRISVSEVNKNKAKNWSVTIAGMASSIAAVATISMLFGLISNDKKVLSNGDLTEKIIGLQAENSRLESEIGSLRAEVNGLLTSVKAISSAPGEHGWKTEAELLGAKLNAASIKLDALETAITADPTKALAIPMLRKDLTNAEKSIKSELMQTKAEIDRMYDQNKWFIGLMFTIALSVLGMAASSFFSRKES